MKRKGMTVRDAVEEMVRELDAIQTDMIKKLMYYEPDDWHEVTTPAVGDRVYVYSESAEGEIVGRDSDLFVVRLDRNGKEASCREDDFEVEYDTILPMWSTMWSFSNGLDIWWLETAGGIKMLSECGFRVYESDEFGYFFGIDGAGYDFYENHWCPLYHKRGLQWHDPAAEQEVQMKRKGCHKERLFSRDFWFDAENCPVEEVLE